MSRGTEMADAQPQAATDADLLPDERALARAQLDSGLPLLAETTLRARIAVLGGPEARPSDELDDVRMLLAEALWRQSRPLEAGVVLGAIRSTSDIRRQPLALMIEADAAASGGHGERARSLVDRVLTAVGAEEAWLLRAGVPSLLEWPSPFAAPAPRVAATPASPPHTSTMEAVEVSAARTAAAHARLEAARAAFTAGDTATGEQELSLALRLDGTIAAAGLELLESMAERTSDRGTIMLFGDLLAAAGRMDEANAAYDRAASGGRVGA